MSDDIPIERTSFDLGRLSHAVEEASARVEADRKALETRIASSQKKTRWQRRAGIVGLVAGIVGTIAGFRAQSAIEEMQRQRAGARVTSCTNDNDTAEKINHLGDALKQIITFATPPNPARTPEQEMRAEQFVAQADGAVDDAKVSERDCTPAGIEAYYSATTTIP